MSYSHDLGVECTTDDTSGKACDIRARPYPHRASVGINCFVLASQQEGEGGPRGPPPRRKPLRGFANVNGAAIICDCVGGRGLSANAAAVDSRGRVCVGEIDIPAPQVGSHGFVTPATVVAGCELF